MHDLNKYKSILNCATQNWKKDSLISNFGIFNQYLCVFVTIFQFLFSMLEYGINARIWNHETEFECFNFYLHVYGHDLAIIET